MTEEFEFFESYFLAGDNTFVLGANPCIADFTVALALAFLKIDDECALTPRM